MEVVNYKCPNCTGALTFDGKTQKMVCEFCGSSFSVEELEELKKKEIEKAKEDTGNHWADFEPEQWQSSDASNMKIYNCPSCGAEIIADDTTGATKCPYCDNPTIIPKQFEDMYRPDYIIPFKKTKKESVAALKKHYEGKPLLPKIFKDQNHMEEIKAVYVPFWLFDLEAGGDCHYEGTKTRSYERGDYRYTETEYYQVERAGKMRFEQIPVDGSEEIDDTKMEAIEPYQYKELEPFQISYLSGYLANKYDKEPDELTGRVEERMQASLEESFRETMSGYESLHQKEKDLHILEKGEVKYALLPVWFLNTKWEGKNYSFVMNGQTGKLIGDLPVAKDLTVQYWLKRHIPLTAAMTIVAVILRLTGVV